MSQVFSTIDEVMKQPFSFILLPRLYPFRCTGPARSVNFSGSTSTSGRENRNVCPFLETILV